MRFILDIDWTVLNFVREHLRCGFLDFLMPKISFLGNLGWLWIVIALVFLFTKKLRRCGIIMLITLAVGLLIGNLALKPLVARSRPCWLDPTTEMLIAIPTDFSFPSGHTLASAIAAAVIFQTDKRLGAIAITIASLIAFSRLYLYVHFPSDIVFAALLGVIIGIVVFRLFNRLLKRKTKISVD